MAARQPTITEVLRQRLIANVDSGVSLREIETETNVIRQSLARFIREEQSLRLDMADRLAAYFDMELKPATKRKGGK